MKRLIALLFCIFLFVSVYSVLAVDVDNEVIEELNQQETVKVIVKLKDNSIESTSQMNEASSKQRIQSKNRPGIESE